MARPIFVTAINCMDGRVQDPVRDWMRRQFRADHVDMITEAGADGFMAAGTAEGLESIKNRVNVSVNAHRSRIVAVIAHHDCAGFPVSPEEHTQALGRCMDIMESWLFPVRRLGLWVGEDWQVEAVYDSRTLLAGVCP